MLVAAGPHHKGCEAACAPCRADGGKLEISVFQYGNTNLTMEISETAHFAQANYLLLFNLATSTLLIDLFFFFFPAGRSVHLCQ